MFSLIPRTVVLLGAASFFNDLSSEMIYPLLPVFLASTLGAGTLQLGLIEGFAESTAAFLKLLSGIWTDRFKRRHPFIIFGYSVAGISRCLIGIAQSWPMVWILRFFDRLGKGVRTSPRDALIADVTPEKHRGKAFGMHRAMDHAGAVIGPLVAALLLSRGGFTVREVFFAAGVPAVTVLVLLAWMGRYHTPSVAVPASPTASHSEGVREPLTREYKTFLAAVFLFELGGSTDAFLLLRLADVGITPSVIALLWSLLHMIKMAANYVAGQAADRLNRRHMLLAGWLLYTLLYLGIGWTSNAGITVLLFLLYGLYCGLTEPTERALISQWATPHARGTYFGYYHMAVGLAALPAGLLFGYFWKTWGAPSAFYMAAGLSAVASLLLAIPPAPGRP